MLSKGIDEFLEAFLLRLRLPEPYIQQKNTSKYSKNMTFKFLWIVKVSLRIIFVLRGSGEVLNIKRFI